MTAKPQRNVIAAGDSFVGIFTLYKRNAKIDTQKFKGGTAKGLCKLEHENRLKLIQMTTNTDYQLGIFNFGQVDVHHSFYYNIFAKSQEPEELIEIYRQVADQYVDFVASLTIPLKLIVAVYPSPLLTSDVPRQLLTYGILEAEEIVNYPPNSWWTICNLDVRHSRLEAFNTALKTACKRHPQVTYISFNDVLTSPDKTVKQEYIDLNPVNPHLLWEPLILLFAEYLDRLDVGVSPHMLTNMQQSASTYNAKKVIEVGDKTFSVGPKMQLIMDYLNEKDRYLNEMRDRNSNTSNANDDDDNNDDSDDDVEFAISLSQHESKIEDLVNQLRILDEERALEKLKNASSKQEITKPPATKDSSLIPIPPPNMPNTNRNAFVNDKNQIKKVVVSGDSRNLKNTNESDTDRYKNHTNVTGLWPVISESSGSGSFEDCETRNGNQKNGKSISRNFDDGNRNNHFNVSSPDDDDSERRSTHQKNDRRRNNDDNDSNRNNYYNVSSPRHDDSGRGNDDHRNTRNSNSSNSTNYNDRNNNNNVSNDRRKNNDNNDYNRNRNSDNDSHRISNSSNGNRSYNNNNNNNNHDNDSATSRNNNNYNNNRSNNNYNASSYNTNNNNNRGNNNYGNNNSNNSGYRSQQINYQDESSSQSNRSQRVILSDKPSHGVNLDAPKLVLSDQDRRRGGGDRDDQDRWGNRDGNDRRGSRDGDDRRGSRDGEDRGQGSSNQGRRGSRGSRDGDGDEDDKSHRSTRIVLSDQRRTNRGTREDGEEPDNIQGVQTLSLSDRFQMFNKGRGKAKDR